MTVIERTAYPTFARALQPQELLTLYTPTPEDVAFVALTARGPSQKFALMILLKVFQKLGYFPAPQHIPGAIITHLRGVMKLPENLAPTIVVGEQFFQAQNEQLQINIPLTVRAIAGTLLGLLLLQLLGTRCLLGSGRRCLMC